MGVFLSLVTGSVAAFPTQGLKVVSISATVATAPTPKIVLTWVPDPGATSWTISRRGTNAAGGTGEWITVTDLPAGSTTYADTRVTRGNAYGYRIAKVGAHKGTGFLLAGIEAPLLESRGKVVLLVESGLAASLPQELRLLEQDLAGDGWEVLRHDVEKSLTPPQVKAIIKSDYDADRTGVKSVFLLGDLPIPYSGANRHACITHRDATTGAQPTDLYYGDMNGAYTDRETSPTKSHIKYRNVPGDGRFDQALIPGDKIIELEVGRVDLSDMPAFKVSEVELIRRYLRKDHDFRHKKSAPRQRSLCIDGWGGRAPVRDLYRNFAPLVGIANLDAPGSYAERLGDPDKAKSSYLLVYGGGGGTPESMIGVATSTDYANNVMGGVVTMGYGSYWHDWDRTNSLFRAPLAAEGEGLASLFCPDLWSLHDLGLGRNIGSAIRRSQSHEPAYYGATGSLYANFMGDPTLRLQYVAPPTNVRAARNGAGVDVTWTAPSAEAAAGYHVYRQKGGKGPFTRLDHARRSTLLKGTSFTDSTPVSKAVYMVRAVKLDTSPSGSFYNPSQGSTVAYPQQLVQVTEATNGVRSNRSLPKASYQTLKAGAQPANGGPYVCSWTGTGSVPASGKGTEVSVYLEQKSSITWTWTANHPSVVTFHWPEPGKTYGRYAGQPNILPIEVGVSDVDGLIAKVEFSDENGRLLGTDTNATWDWKLDPSGTYFGIWDYIRSPAADRFFRSRQPYLARYKCAWNDPAVGNHTLNVKVTDLLGGVTSSSVKFKVEPRTVQAPNLVKVVSPEDGATYTTDRAKFNFQANVCDSDGTITKAEFFMSVDGGPWKSYSGSRGVSLPFLQLEEKGVLQWVDPPNTVRLIQGGYLSKMAIGKYSLKVVATDNHGASTPSAPVNIVVGNK